MLNNLTFQITEPIMVRADITHPWKSSEHAGKNVCVKDGNYLMTHVMPGCNLIGIIAESGDLHYLPAKHFTAVKII